jgi:hypothetical protein
MRLRGDMDQKVLGELFYQYMNVEEEFIRRCFTHRRDPARARFRARAGPLAENALQVLDYERASEVIRTATHRGIGVCYCRHKMQHVGKNCDAPMDICMTFNGSASSLTRAGMPAWSTSRRAGSAPAGLRTQPGAVRRERPARRQLHLQLLRLLLRGHDRGAQVRHAHPGPYHQLPAGGRSAGLHRLRQVCERLPGGGHDAGFCQRPAPPQPQDGQDWMKTCLGCGVCVRTCSQQGLSLKIAPRSA